jgi:hypothetical protein
VRRSVVFVSTNSFKENGMQKDIYLCFIDPMKAYDIVCGGKDSS